MKQFLGFFVHRPLLVNLTLVFVIMAGLIIASQLEYNTYPDLDMGAVTITTARPGASPEDVELSVTIPLEEEILKVDGLDKVISNSFEGMSDILVRMDPNNDKAENDRVESELQRALDRASGRLPDDLPQKPYMARHLSDRLPVVEVMVSGNVAEETLRQAARKVQNSLREVPGIAGVGRKGYRKREVRILLDANTIQRLGISFNEITAAIKRRNIRDSGGSIESFVSEQDILVVGQFEDPKDVEDVIVRSAGPGNYVRIRDIAKVVYDYENWTIQTLTDGNFGITLLPRKKADADGLTVADNIDAFITRIQPSLPPGVEITKVNDLSRFTRSMLNVLMNNALAGMALVFIVLLCFFPLRFTFWVTFGIPTAILMAFALMPAFNLDVSQLSMASLILMLGILVDDAVVTSESIFRRAEHGHSPIDAAILGTSDVAPPVITSAATTLLAFAPAAFLGGIEGKFMWVIPAMAMLVLMTSLIECKTMLPVHMRHSLEQAARRKQTIQARQWFHAVEKRYFQFMLRVMPNRYKSLLIILVSMSAIAYWSINRVPINLYPDVAVDAFFIQAELPNGYAFENTRDKLAEIEQHVRQKIPAEDLLTITRTVGHHDYDIKQVTSGRRQSWGLIGVYLKPLDERDTDVIQLQQELREELKQVAEFTWINVTPQRETPVTGEAIELNIIGNDEERFVVADEVTRYLKSHPATTAVWTSYSPGKDVIDLELNHEAIAHYGLDTSDVTMAVRAAFDGHIVEELQTVDERIDYRLQFDSPDQGSVQALKSLVLINHDGLPVPLRNLVSYQLKAGEAAIKHYFGDRTITVYADIDRDKISTAQINTDLANYIDKAQLRERYNSSRLLFGGQFTAQNEAIKEVQGAFLLCMIGIIFILVLLFNSMTQPLLTISIIPLGFVGVIFAFASHGLEMSMAAMIGVLGLAGVLVNGSLVMIDRLNQEKSVDKPFLTDREIVECATLRLRPIVITTITTVAGLLPAAYGWIGENPFITPMIMAMLWGVLFGSFITLIYLPCLYALEQDARRALNKHSSPVTH